MRVDVVFVIARTSLFAPAAAKAATTAATLLTVASQLRVQAGIAACQMLDQKPAAQQREDNEAGEQVLHSLTPRYRQSP